MALNKQKPRTYFRDRLILLLLSVNTFLALALLITALLAINDSDAGYIREYRSDLGLDGYKAGGLQDILAFGAFSIILYVFTLLSSIKIYHIRRHLSVVILFFGTVIYIFGLLSLNALLSLV